MLRALVRINKNVKSSLEESRLVFRLIVVSKLDLALVSGKLTGLIKGDGMGAVQDVITGLEYKETTYCTKVQLTLNKISNNLI